MGKKEIFRCGAFAVSLILFMVPATSSGRMGDLDVPIEISATEYQEWMPNLEYNPVDNEFMVLWHMTGIREEGGENAYSLHGQRISSSGQLVGGPFSPYPPVGPERKVLPRLAHNHFTNEYMVLFSVQQPGTGQDPFVTILANDGSILSDVACVSAQPTTASHPVIAFNSERGEFLISYNDSRNGVADIWGVIVDETGAVVKDDFSICDAEGEQMNPQICYNPTDDTYLINWEDFRHAPNWTEPGDLYGILLDGDGTLLKDDIAMVDDYGAEDAGDQRVQIITYNSHKNEFLACWWDSRPSLDDGGVVGRIIASDGTPSGSDFTLADATGSQSFPHAEYVEKRRMYFLIWDDTRNDPGDGEGSPDRDVYGRWISATGRPVGPEIPIVTEERSQRYSELVYNPVMDQFLIAWRDEVEEQLPDEEETDGHVTITGGNVMGKIYGTPSFISGQVTEEGTGDPVEDARVMIFGLSLPAMKTTNVGGWFNVAERSQLAGTYFILVSKEGYELAIEPVPYSGEPAEVAIELTEK